MITSDDEQLERSMLMSRQLIVISDILTVAFVHFSLLVLLFAEYSCIFNLTDD